ncbi:chlorohydrolase [Streptococcus pneumoniae]|nr:chlorohydrolase [Streptococcus pneumoniae]VKM33193.1 chlorohydrolase [Streptococcus pneumoniae]VMR19766.1 chlorohydrolase [Streptococcus pneumoniae]VMR74255.1 chlorohydrolase [Streptococcus pneumoniae]VMU25717.1 chlorohydrolase [Streptococcus pneumoniae]
MKIKEQTRKLAAGCSKHCFEVVDETDEVSNHTYGKVKLTWFEEIFEEYNMNLIYEARLYETWLQLEKGE